MASQPQPTRTYDFSGGQNAVADDVDTDLNTLYTVLQGGIGNTHIASDAVIALSKLASDARTAYTPSLLKNDNSTSLTGTAVGRSTKIGRDVIVEISLTAMGDPSGAAIYFTLPYSAAVLSRNSVVGSGYAVGTGLTADIGVVTIESGSETKGRINVRANVAWGTGSNQFLGTIVYESAA